MYICIHDTCWLQTGGKTESTSMVLRRLSGDLTSDLPTFFGVNNFMIVKLHTDSSVLSTALGFSYATGKRSLPELTDTPTHRQLRAIQHTRLQLCHKQCSLLEHCISAALARDRLKTLSYWKFCTEVLYVNVACICYRPTVARTTATAAVVDGSG